MQTFLEAVIFDMATHSEAVVNGQIVFIGSPRDFMESHGVSSGPAYQALYNLGVKRLGRGKRATWFIPEELVQKTPKEGAKYV
jgi:hypothetical protein